MYGAIQRIVTSSNLLFGRMPRLALLVMLLVVGSVTTVSAQYCTPDQCDECNLCQCSQRCCHELPELWLVNTRCAPRCRNLDNGFDCLIYKRYDRKCCRWVKESRESFLAQEADRPTLFYSHGNSLNHKNAMKSCWQVYCKMRCCPGPKRLVFWSWPAERVYKTEGLRVREMIEKNLRIKYVYAEYQAYYMAKLVNQMSLSQRVMMSGHSYGGITAAAAAHFLGGGCLRGLTLDGGAAQERTNLRAAVISGAFDHDMLNPGNRYGQTFVAAEKVYVTRNIKDRTLKKWPKTSWRCKQAIGVLGVNANCLGQYRNKLCQQTMTSDVGTSHYLTPHLKSVRFVAALCCLSFPACHDCPVAVTEEDEEEELVTEEQLAEEEAFAQELAIEDPEAELELIDYTEEISDLTAWQHEEFNEIDIVDVFGDGSYAEAFATSDFELADPPVSVAGVEAIRPEPEPEDVESVVSENSQPVEQSPAQPVAQTVTETSSDSLWRSCGFGLALVLTGQFYVRLGKRMPSA